MTILNTFRKVYQGVWQVKIGMLIILTALSFSLQADCPESLGCNDNVQISLDYDCFAVIRPELILEDEMEDCDYRVTILDLNDKVIATTQINPNTGDPVFPAVDGSFIGKVWKASVSVTDTFGITISCWGYFTVEDKLPPSITCIDDITVDCSEDLSELYSSMSTITYCSEPNPVDMDTDPDTKTICLTTSDTTHAWEIIESVLISGPVTGSGSGLLGPATGSGSIKMDGISYQFQIDPLTGQISGSQLEGVQTDEDIKPKIMLIVDESNDLSDGICIDFNASSFFKFQRFDNCDPDTRVIVTRDQVEDLQCDESNNFTARRDIAYFTEDNAGLSTQPCEFSIFFEKKSLIDLEFPDNVKFSCSDPAIFDDDGMLDLGPHVTGFPLLDGDPLTDQNNLCRINVTFTDDTFNICGVNTIKILRRWTALDWCEGQYSQAYQSIKVHDIDAPEIICPDGFLIYEADGDCTADILFKPLDQNDTTGVELIAECSSFSVNVKYQDANGNFVNASPLANNMFRVFDLPYGYHTIKYIFTDECGNIEECTFVIRVIDDAAPIPVCDEFTAVTLGSNGWARAYTQTFDDGSYDDCGGPVTFKVRRPVPHCGLDTLFKDFVEFCCEDAGQTVDVILKVTDAGGRMNTCRVKVEVQDKTPYNVISCPDPFIHLDCSQSIDTSLLGVPLVDDNCAPSGLEFIDTGDYDSICGIGTIIRTWYVRVNGILDELSQCKQTITITNQDPLTFNDFDWPPVERTDATCMNFQTDLGDTVRYQGIPVNEVDFCGKLAYSFKDKVFRDVEGFCLKIIRTWTVIDWCLYNPNSQDERGIWTHTQIIKVTSQDGPVLSNCSRDTSLFILDNSCTASIFLEAPQAFDPCFEEDIPPSRINYELRNINADTIVRTGTGNLLPTVLERGRYRITWSAEGVCGVAATCSSIIDVFDGKAPTPYCKSGITTVLMPPGIGNQEPQIGIWAVDFDLNSTDNCDDDLVFSFHPDTIVPGIIFTCDDLGLQTLDVWVIDDDGNKDFCHTAINIQANNNICPIDSSGMMMALGGKITLEDNAILEGVEVALENMYASSMRYNDTDNKGYFNFYDVEAHKDYRLNASGGNDYLNGVSTLDLILIQRHILGIKKLPSAYKVIAADINNSKEISALDLIELRKLILGIYNELPESDSWRFVDRKQQFPDPVYPWPVEDKIDIHDLSTDRMDNDFVAVKIGDVNGSADLDYLKNNPVKSNEQVAELTYDILELNSPGEYLIPFYINKEMRLQGFQLELEFENPGLIIQTVESGKSGTMDGNVRIDNNKLFMSWHTNDAINNVRDEALFYLTVRSGTPLNVGSFKLAGQQLQSELYDSELNRYDIVLNPSESGGENRLYQNIPNPFSHTTDIEFELSDGGEVTINIMDLSGRLIKSMSGVYKKGKHSITIHNHELNGNGIYYFMLESGNFSATRKMILIE